MNDVVEIVDGNGKLVFVVSAELMTPEVLSLLESEYNSNSRGGLELAPAWSHKPNDVGSNPTLAPNEVKDALEIQMVRHKEIRQDRPAYRANLVVSADALPDEGQQEPAASATEPSEVN